MKITSPLIFPSFLMCLFLLIGLENQISWGRYETNVWDYFNIFVIFLFAYLSGYFSSHASLSRSFEQKRRLDLQDVSVKGLYFILGVSVFFLLLKLWKLGQIPLLSSDPTIRSTGESLGGVVDYPVRLISLVGIVAFYLKAEFQYEKHMPLFYLAIIINLLLMNRAEILMIAFAAILIKYKSIAMKPKEVLRLFLIFSTLLFVVVALLAVIRYGKQNISSDMPILALAIWIIHGDLTGALSFGSYVSDQLDGELLYGRYTFGEYASIIVPSYGAHGAEYLRDTYLPTRETAQSVAAPFNFFIDFGYMGVAVLSFISGFLTRYLQFSFELRTSGIAAVIYIIFLFNLFLSTRNGVFAMTPLLVYYLLALTLVFPKKGVGYIFSFTRSSISLLFLGSLWISLTVGLLRV